MFYTAKSKAGHIHYNLIGPSPSDLLKPCNLRAYLNKSFHLLPNRKVLAWHYIVVEGAKVDCTITLLDCNVYGHLYYHCGGVLLKLVHIELGATVQSNQSTPKFKPPFTSSRFDMQFDMSIHSLFLAMAQSQSTLQGLTNFQKYGSSFSTFDDFNRHLYMNPPDSVCTIFSKSPPA